MPVDNRPDIEQQQAGEQETIQWLNETHYFVLHRTAEDYGRAVRSGRAEPHGVLNGELAVAAGLPPELAQGLFAQADRHKLVLTLSTNAGDILPDVIILPLGLALEVFDVEGGRLPRAERTAQDFVMVNGKLCLAPMAKNFLGNLQLLAKITDRLGGAKQALSAALRGRRHASEAVGAKAPAAVVSLDGSPHFESLRETGYSATPFRGGSCIAKFSRKPVAADMVALTGTEIEVDGRQDVHLEVVRKEMQAIDAAWEFRVQLCLDLDPQPVEDPTVGWTEDESPFFRVGVLQAAWRYGGAAAPVTRINEQTRFMFLTGIEGHRLLGNVNGARRHTYGHSADFSGHAKRLPLARAGRCAARHQALAQRTSRAHRGAPSAPLSDH